MQEQVVIVHIHDKTTISLKIASNVNEKEEGINMNKHNKVYWS